MIASAYFERMLGLLGRKSFPEGSGLLLMPCKCVHTFFMRFPIDVIFLDKEFSVVEIEEGMRPFRISSFYPKAYCALEVPSGTVKATATEKGDVICLRRWTICPFP